MAKQAQEKDISCTCGHSRRAHMLMEGACCDARCTCLTFVVVFKSKAEFDRARAQPNPPRYIMFREELRCSARSQRS